MLGESWARLRPQLESGPLVTVCWPLHHDEQLSREKQGLCQFDSFAIFSLVWDMVFPYFLLFGMSHWSEGASQTAYLPSPEWVPAQGVAETRVLP